MRTSASRSWFIPLLSVLLLIALAACAPHAAQPASAPGNIPSGKGADPEPGTNGAPAPMPNGHSESIIATNDLAFIGSDNQMLYAIGASDGKVHWQFKAGDSVLVYAVANGVVYATAGGVLYALNASSGSLLWQSQAKVQISQVLVSNGVVYANTAAEGDTSTLVALDAATGTLRWQYTLHTIMPGLQAVVAGTVYDLQTSGGPGAPDAALTIHALRASDGHPLWQAPVAGADGLIDNAPATDNSSVYFVTSLGALYAFDTTSGQLRWHVASQPDGNPGSPLSSSPVVVNGLVYIGASQGISAYRASDGRRQWQDALTTFGPFPPQPVLADGVVYVDAGGQVYALRASDGGVIWQHQAPGVAQSLVVSAGLVISDAGPVFALRASDGTLVWQRPETPSGVGTLGAGKPETVSGGIVYIGSDGGTVSAIQASSGTERWQYQIQELPVQTPPVLSAAVTFAPSLSYAQALEIVTNLGLKTFAECHPEAWTAGDDKDFFADGHFLSVAATVNSAPLWMGRLKATPGVTDAQSLDGPIHCPAETAGSGPQYLPQDQAGVYVRVTFTGASSYTTALDTVNSLGFRLADPCYEQARAQGRKPTWHPMSEADAFGQTRALVLATTLYNAITWANQLRAVGGVVTIDAPFRASC